MPILWLQNIRYFLYFLREFTGVAIGLYLIFFLASALLDPSMAFTKYTTFKLVSWIGLSAAIFHSLTWFWVTIKIAPFPTQKFARAFAFVILIGGALGISYIIFPFLYE